jgi:GTPase
VADYPFTTLQPNLGVVRLSDSRTFVLADIPGIIEGAHEGKGLGLRFLRHIERTRILAFLIPADSEDPDGELATLRAELAAHSEKLAGKPFCVVISKSDLMPPDSPPPLADPEDAWGRFVISAVTGDGLDPWLEELWRRLRLEAERHRLEGGDEDAEPDDDELDDDELDDDELDDAALDYEPWRP